MTNKNLYSVEYEEVSGYSYPVVIQSDLPTHILAANLSNAVEVAMKFAAPDFQVKSCTVLFENAIIETDSLE